MRTDLIVVACVSLSTGILMWLSFVQRIVYTSKKEYFLRALFLQRVSFVFVVFLALNCKYVFKPIGLLFK